MSKNEFNFTPEEYLEKGKFSIEYLASCGIYCGLCYQVLREKQKCYGCYSKKGFAKMENKLCGIVKCCKKQNISRCNECEIFPNCTTLQKFATWDSFVTHAPSIENLERLTELGEEEFIRELRERTKRGEYPPTVRPDGMKLKNIISMMKKPYKKQKKKLEK